MNHIAVMGLGRCGASLVMQMLAAGGAKVTGKYPDHELPELSDYMMSREPMDLSHLAPGTAVKFLDPLRYDFPVNLTGIQWFGIWCSRNPREQAASMAKVLRGSGLKPQGGNAWLTASIRRETAVARRAVDARCAYVLDVAFEEILAAPARAAAAIAGLYEQATGVALDVDAMARVPFPRSPSSFPGMLEPYLTAASDLGLVGQQSASS